MQIKISSFLDTRIGMDGVIIDLYSTVQSFTEVDTKR